MRLSAVGVVCPTSHNLVKIFESDDLKDSNIFVISHRNRDTFEDIFDGSYEIYREQGFSQLRDMNEVQT